MRIRELTLFTSVPEQQFRFYADVLGFPVSRTEEGLEIIAGDTILRFCYRKNASPTHFAFNIPPYAEHKALEWLRDRVELIPFEDEPIIDFSNWNARALYFYDGQKNIVEFISRRDLSHPGVNDAFSAKDILNVSEIGVAVSDIKDFYDNLQKLKPVGMYDGNFDSFCAVGDPNGLFIIVDREKKTWFPADDPVEQSDFIISGDYNFAFKDGKIESVTC
ncbi:VOC family protein [Robertkochia aurantiaca]|uniref:VOC family protein n=1 Tax=Robertkochia aurantiaca TaxID=2873700 RepID=UPI001CC9567F|nr:VOC family protein [Robertkochia sp. 3YJGBD-33]